MSEIRVPTVKECGDIIEYLPTTKISQMGTAHFVQLGYQMALRAVAERRDELIRNVPRDANIHLMSEITAALGDEK